MYHIKEVWKVQLKREHHMILEVREGILYDTMTLTSNGLQVLKKRVGFLNLQGTQRFTLDGVQVSLKWKWKFTLTSAKPGSILLERDGRLLAKMSNSNESIEPSKNVDVPRWAWIFMGACALIPIVSLGGAVPVMAGIFGFTTCRSISTNTSRSIATNVMLCAGVTIAMWIAVIAVVGGVLILTNS